MEISDGEKSEAREAVLMALIKFLIAKHPEWIDDLRDHVASAADAEDDQGRSGAAHHVSELLEEMFDGG